MKELFSIAVELLGSTDEEIRSAASFTTGNSVSIKIRKKELNKIMTGNIAVGNLHLFLPTIVKLVQNDKEKRLLALHALKEVSFFIVSTWH